MSSPSAVLPAAAEILAIAKEIPVVAVRTLTANNAIATAPGLINTYLGEKSGPILPNLSRLKREQLWRRINGALEVSRLVAAETASVLEQLPTRGFEGKALGYAGRFKLAWDTPELLAESDPLGSGMAQTFYQQGVLQNNETRTAFARAYTLGVLRTVQTALFVGIDMPHPNYIVEPIWAGAVKKGEHARFNNLLAMQMGEIAVQQAIHGVLLPRIGKADLAKKWLTRYVPARAIAQLPLVTGMAAPQGLN